jgi:rRNA maturation endonuclease Nob1
METNIYKCAACGRSYQSSSTPDKCAVCGADSAGQPRTELDKKEEASSAKFRSAANFAKGNF